jgi:hypothetical protein
LIKLKLLHMNSPNIQKHFSGTREKFCNSYMKNSHENMKSPSNYFLQWQKIYRIFSGRVLIMTRLLGLFGLENTCDEYNNFLSYSPSHFTNSLRIYSSSNCRRYLIRNINRSQNIHITYENWNLVGISSRSDIDLICRLKTLQWLESPLNIRTHRFRFRSIFWVWTSSARYNILYAQK